MPVVNRAPPPGELAQDPLYPCVQAQMEGRGESCASCCTSSCINLGRVSYGAAELCLSPLITRRSGTPSDSPNMRQAFITGWTMLTSFVFPLVPSHGLRCIWVLAQLLFVIVIVSMSYTVSFYQRHDSTGVHRPHLEARNVIGVLSGFAAVIDMVCCFVILVKRWLCDPNVNPEAQPLIQRRHQNVGPSLWFSKYNDLFRLIVTEMILYAVLICSLPLTAQDLHEQPITGHGNYTPSDDVVAHPQHLAYVKFVTFIVMVIGFVLFVYIFQLLLLARMYRIKTQLTPRSPARRKAFFLFVHLIVHYIGQRAIQVVMLVTFVYVQINSHTDDRIHQGRLDIIFLAYLTPVITLLTSLVLYYGWIEDVCTTQCIDYLQKLDKLGSTPQTSQAVKDEIERVLTFYDYQNISNEVDQFSQRNFSRNCLYPLQSPVAMLLCLPSLACLVAYLCRLFSDVDELGWVLPQVVSFVIIDAHLVFVVFCMMVILPVAAVVLSYRVCCRER